MLSLDRAALIALRVEERLERQSNRVRSGSLYHRGSDMRWPPPDATYQMIPGVRFVTSWVCQERVSSQLVRPSSTRSIAQSSSSRLVIRGGMNRRMFPSGPHSMMMSSRSKA